MLLFFHVAAIFVVLIVPNFVPFLDIFLHVPKLQNFLKYLQKIIDVWLVQAETKNKILVLLT